MKSRRRIVWFHRGRAIIWAIVGVLSFPLGWANSVVLVWIASLYANVSTDWGNGEAADNRELLDRLDELETLIREGACCCAQGRDQRGRPDGDRGEHERAGDGGEPGPGAVA